jgi:Ca-activated chloride channel homolog
MYALEYPWLLLVVILPLVVWLLLPPYREERLSVRIPYFDRVAEAAGIKPSSGAVIMQTSWLQRIVAPICWCLVVLALARPVFIEPPIERIQPARDLMLALDLSQSMETNDFVSPEGKRVTRISAVKSVVDDFIQRRKGDRIGLIVFGAAAYPEAPFTLDHEICRTMLKDTQPGMAGPTTMIGDAIGLAIKQFATSKAEERVLIILTDGNDTGSSMPPEKAAEIARDRGIKIHTIAIGNPNASGSDKVDINLMKSIASTTGGRFFIGQDGKQLSEVYAVLDQITPKNYNVDSYRPKRQLFMYPLGAALLLIVGYHVAVLLWGFLATMFKRPASEEGS